MNISKTKNEYKIENDLPAPLPISGIGPITPDLFHARVFALVNDFPLLHSENALLGDGKPADN